MPVKSLNSSVLKWPDAKTVENAVRQWAAQLARNRKGIIRIGIFGSYARGDWGAGSDVDIVVLVESDPRPFTRRAAAYDSTGLPVPADLLVYTITEWEALVKQDSRMMKELNSETKWIYP